MKTLTKNAFFALIATTLLASCGRPYATFQKSTPEHFYTKTTPVAPVTETSVATELAVAEATPAVAPSLATEAVAAPVTVAAAQTKLNDLLAANKTALSTDKKLTTRLNRVQKMLAATTEKQALTPANDNAKMSLMAKMVTKKINKQIEKKLAPKAAQTKSAIRLGIIVGIIGLLLLIIGGGFFGTLGGILLFIGLLGILLGYLDVL